MTALDRLARLAALLLALAAPASAWAQASESDARALELGREGMTFFERGQWSAAHERFAAADQLSHSPVFRLYAARSLSQASRLLAARDLYRALIDERLPEDAPTQWQQAKRDGKAELVALEPKIPSVVVKIVGSGAPEELTIDGRPVTPGTSVDLDPGKHHVLARTGARERRAEVELREGDRDRRVEIVWDPPGATTDERAAGAPPEVVPGSSEGSWVPGIVLLGTGGVALLAGAVTGGLALSRADDIKAKCGAEDGTCPASLRSEIEPDVASAEALGHASTGLLVGGGVVAVLGLVLVIVRPGGDDATASSKGAWLAPAPGGLTLGGRF